MGKFSVPIAIGIGFQFSVFSSRLGVLASLLSTFLRYPRNQREIFSSSIILLLSSIFLFPANGFSQHVIPENDAMTVDPSYYFNANHSSSLHSAVKPVLDVDVYDHRRDSADGFDDPRSDYEHEFMTQVNSKYQRTHGKNEIDPGFSRGSRHFALIPIYDLSAGNDLYNKKFLYNGTGGVIIDADIRQKVGMELRFVGGVSSMPGYLTERGWYIPDQVMDTLVMPAQFPAYGERAYASANGSYTFQHISGNLIYRPSKAFNIQVGRDKHFWGDGHRSLFLSDLGAAMPYLKMQTTIWKLQYTSLFTMMQDWTDPYGNGSVNDVRHKFGTFHYIDFNAAKWLNIGVFEAVVWQGTGGGDPHAFPDRIRGFDPNYLNPLIFFRPVEYSLGSSDNAMLGLAGKIRFNENNVFYGQLILDEFYLKEIKNWKAGWWANKQGIQAGYKIFSVGQVDGLNMQMEVNIVRPYTYSHGSPQQNYANGGTPLAHPLGAGFYEGLGIMSYYHKGFSIQGELVIAAYGLDTANKNYGHNIFLSYTTRSATSTVMTADYDHHNMDGLKTLMSYMELRSSYRFNTKFPIRLELVAGKRKESSFANGIRKAATEKHKSTYVQLGLSLPLFRATRDY